MRYIANIERYYQQHSQNKNWKAWQNFLQTNAPTTYENIGTFRNPIIATLKYSAEFQGIFYANEWPSNKIS